MRRQLASQTSTICRTIDSALVAPSLMVGRALPGDVDDAEPFWPTGSGTRYAFLSDYAENFRTHANGVQNRLFGGSVCWRDSL